MKCVGEKLYITISQCATKYFQNGVSMKTCETLIAGFLILSFIALFLTLGDINIDSTSTFFGLKFKNLNAIWKENSRLW